MKDPLIAIAILLVLVAVFSHTDVQPDAPSETHGDNTEGESETVQSDGNNFLQDIPEQSPQTGDRWGWFTLRKGGRYHL